MYSILFKQQDERWNRQDRHFLLSVRHIIHIIKVLKCSPNFEERMNFQGLHDVVGATDKVKGEVWAITSCSAIRLHSCDGCARRDACIGRTRAGHHERWQQWEGEDANADEEQDDPVPRQLEPLDGPASEEGAEAASRQDDQTDDLRGQPVGESVLLLHELWQKGGVAVDDGCVASACN